MTLDANECVARLEAKLSEAREHARVQQNTLDDILQLLQRLLILDMENPRNPNQIPGAPAATPRVPILTTPVSDSTPHAQACSLKPATPNNFDGDHLKGQAFLNSCRLYIALWEDQFRDEQTKIHWALSFTKSGRVALYAHWILWNKSLEVLLHFITWWDFKLDFSAEFCPKNEATAALTKLESTCYYQENKVVDDYIDEFLELINEAGYTDGLSIVIKFRRGLDQDIQDCIAEIV